MKAILVETLGGPEVFKIGTTETPVPGKGQIRIQVKAASLNYSDLQIAGDFYPGHANNAVPYVAGREAAGIVDAVGEGVTHLEVGDKVMALGVRGAFADFAICMAVSAVPMPAGWSFAAAAGFQLPHLAAVAAIESCGQTKAGDIVLIHAAASSVGQAMIKLAKHLGATVIATASNAEKLQVAACLGADHVINYVDVDFAEAVTKITGGRGVDVAVDTVAGDVMRKTLSVMRPCGKLVIAGNASNSPVTFTHYELLSTYRCSLVTLELGTMIIQRPDLMKPVRARLNELIESKVFEISEPNVYELTEGPHALKLMATRKLIGSTVLSL